MEELEKGEHDISSDTETLPSVDSTVRRKLSRTHTPDNLREDSVFTQRIEKILDILKDDIISRNLYSSLFAQLSLFIFYLFIMNLQFEQLNAYETASCISASVKPNIGLDFLPWLKTQVFYIWKEPICGDGICEGPAEFPAFGRFGCKEDCGIEPEISPVLVYVEADFSSLHEESSLPAHVIEILWQRVRWNVCTLSENNMRSEVCWFEADRRLKTAAHRDLLELSLSQGEWYVRVTRDALGMVRGLVMDNVAPFREIPTLPTWSPCTASETPSARALQQTASRTLLDAPLDPLLRVESAPAQRLGLSGLHSESSGQDVPAPSKDTGEGAWTAVPDGLLVLVGGEDAHHPLSYSSPAGDCKRICERSAPCGGFSYNDTSASSPSSPPPSCVFTTCLAPGARWVRSR
ncbi:hypothetical protein CYMTET_56019 [Cymbomonas tetramitiformis]|uniref:Uncharacterized protein n=1 Tax=Cymbomonas tetramitiformis TaxID=36881 RepID=A0AAE0EP63_9CHLO|nr:hypothetical protein CYMTET_56019 [Cymbomonas tetramitiformis]